MEDTATEERTSGFSIATVIVCVLALVVIYVLRRLIRLEQRVTALQNNSVPSQPQLTKEDLQEAIYQLSEKRANLPPTSPATAPDSHIPSPSGATDTSVKSQEE